MRPDNFKIPLHDARLEGYSRQGDSLVVSITKWDATVLQIRCLDVVLVQETIGDGDLEESVECQDSNLLCEAKRRLADMQYPANDLEQLRHFRLVDNSAYAVLDVICKEIVEE